jgi:hypothetical protein
MYVQRNAEARSCNHCFSGKAISITYSECVCVFVDLQCACAIFSSVPCPARLYFSKLFHKRKDFRKKLLNIIYLFLFSLQILSGTSLILMRIQRDVVKNICWISREVPVILVIS